MVGGARISLRPLALINGQFGRIQIANPASAVGPRVRLSDFGTSENTLLHVTLAPIT
ncbi:MAG: hypothetical protein ACJAS2_001880 [Pseudohongiellaceae bacterium]